VSRRSAAAQRPPRWRPERGLRVVEAKDQVDGGPQPSLDLPAQRVQVNPVISDYGGIAADCGVVLTAG
jgi:hypothetical protein